MPFERAANLFISFFFSPSRRMQAGRSSVFRNPRIQFHGPPPLWGGSRDMQGLISTVVFRNVWLPVDAMGICILQGASGK